ncbi:hypothetical protein TeGR_g14338 [Tetraparma gracilis]|uniref:Uncharacterized protein n=1 Tax=Tetraparma gracilis TaxID=2962635 RepID=A0ABQ6N698_9STRA|nr:hypothetical protein TeGR_g14338 [Tetraparma gracilis]
MHGIGDVDAAKQGKKKRRATQPKRSDKSDSNTNDVAGSDEVPAPAPRSRRARAAVDYAEPAGDSDGPRLSGQALG